MGQHSLCNSMDLRVLLEECAEDDDSSGAGERETAAVYLKIPAAAMLASERSLWSSASTMTASIRTMMSSHSLMSHYSKESLGHFHPHSSGHHKCSSLACTLDSSHRSLFCKTEEERPIRPPRRTRSREFHFNSNAREQPIRRPVRTPSDRSMLGSSAHDSAAVITGTPVASEPLLPPLNLYDSSANLSFRLIRSLSEQTMDTTWREAKKERSKVKPTPSCRSLFKRTLSDSLLLFTESVGSQAFAVMIDEEHSSHSER